MRDTDLRVPVLPHEEQQIVERAQAFNYPHVARYARAVLSDPYGSFTRDRFLELQADVTRCASLLQQEHPAAADRLRALRDKLQRWIARPAQTADDAAAPREKTLRIPVLPAERKRILDKTADLDYPQFAPYARTILRVPFGVMTHARLLDIYEEVAESIDELGNGTLPLERLRALELTIEGWTP